jgi:hypothetical protein
MASRMRPALVLTCVLCAWCTASGDGGQTDSNGALVDRFLTRVDVPLESYRSSRRMTARNPRYRKEAWVEVEASLDATHGFTYSVVASGGSGMVLNRVLLPALKNEAEMWQRGDPARHALSRDNYQFLPDADGSGDDDPELVRIGLRPLRKHILLVDGAVLLSAADGDLVRVEGRLSKSPSFWVSRVEVVRRYARIAGVRVPVELHSVAHVRLAGRSEMRITYEYASINGQDVASP